MKKFSTWRSLLLYPLYPWLLVTYMIVFLYSQNIPLLIGIEVIYALIAAWIFVTIAIKFFSFATGSLAKASAIVGVLSFTFLSYGHVINAAPRTTGDREFYLAVVVPSFVMVWAIWRVKILTKLSPRLVVPVNLILAYLLIFPLFQIGRYYAFTSSGVDLSPETISSVPKVKNSADRPDIYYIILDGYSSNAHLMRDYGYDNSDFTNALEERGFFVADESTSNYGATLASLPSSLNMRYFDEDDAAKAGAFGVEYTRDMLSYNRVASDLRNLGYSYINMMSGFTAPTGLADENIDFYPAGMTTYQLNGQSAIPVCTPTCYQQSFINYFLHNTMLRPVFPNAFVSFADAPYAWNDPYRHLAMWEAAPSIAQKEEATFAFVHLIPPHAPVNFNEKGEIIPHPLNLSPDVFFPQLRFVNKQVLNMIDEIIEKSSVPPIIILQADHGTNLGSVWDPEGKHLFYFEILNAFYWPGAPEGTIPSNITPVNTFRLLFNTYFGTDYELLENRHFDVLGGYDDIFYMEEVNITDLIQTRPRPIANNKE